MPFFATFRFFTDFADDLDGTAFYPACGWKKKRFFLFMPPAESCDGFLDQHGAHGPHQVETRVGRPPGGDQIRSRADMDEGHPETDDRDKDQIHHDIPEQKIFKASFLRLRDIS